MAFGPFRKRLPETDVFVSPASPAPRQPDAAAPEADSAKDILELLELELGGMIRQLERAATSVAGGAEATTTTPAATREPTGAHGVPARPDRAPIAVAGATEPPPTTLAAIRERTDALSGRTSAARDAATTFA